MNEENKGKVVAQKEEGKNYLLGILWGEPLHLDTLYTKT